MTQLQSDQTNLLALLVEAHRSVERSQRQPFLTALEMDGIRVGLNHPGLGDRTHTTEYDLAILQRQGLILVRELDHPGTLEFHITPEGISYYEQIREKEAEGVRQVELSVQQYLYSTIFRERHGQALDRWLEAQGALWVADSGSEHTRIGHICREAVQEFAKSALELSKATDFETNPTKTIERIRAVIKSCKPGAGKTTVACLDALLRCLEKLIPLIQRQEHGSQREGSNLLWKDSRRVVFHTAILMYEIDSVIGESS